MLTRDQILAADDLKREIVEVPEWGGSVYVAMMSGDARDAWEASIIDGQGNATLRDVRAKLVAATITDEAGVRLFTAEDVAGLSKRSAVALDRVVNVARRLNRLGSQELEDAAKN